MRISETLNCKTFTDVVNGKYLRYRAATTNDIEALRDCAVATFLTEYGTVASPEDVDAYVNTSYSIETLTKEVESPEALYYLVFELDGDLQRELSCVAFLKLSWGLEQIVTKYQGDSSALEIQRVYVRAAFQNYGIGSKLMKFAADFGQEQTINQKYNFKYLWLTVTPGKEAAVRFYQRHGFHRVGSFDFPVNGQIVVDDIYEKDLF